MINIPGDDWHKEPPPYAVLDKRYRSSNPITLIHEPDLFMLVCQQQARSIQHILEAEGKTVKDVHVHEDTETVFVAEVEFEDEKEPEMTFSECCEKFEDDIFSICSYLRDPYANGFGTGILPTGFSIVLFPDQQKPNVAHITFPGTTIRAACHATGVIQELDSATA